MSLFRAAIGQKSTPEAYMTPRERSDFAILVSVFSALLASSVALPFSSSAFFSQPSTSINAFSILTSQWLVCSALLLRVLQAKLIVSRHPVSLRLLGQYFRSYGSSSTLVGHRGGHRVLTPF